jgi:hypothetical protein
MRLAPGVQGYVRLLPQIREGVEKQTFYSYPNCSLRVKQPKRNLTCKWTLNLNQTVIFSSCSLGQLKVEIKVGGKKFRFAVFPGRGGGGKAIKHSNLLPTTIDIK